jgi:hypothetical protein
LITLALQLVHKFEHKWKKEKTSPLEIRDKVQEDFVLVCKKCLMKHGGQVVKQVLKPKRILKYIASSEPIIQEISQHSGIGSHLFYFNL